MFIPEYSVKFVLKLASQMEFNDLRRVGWVWRKECSAKTLPELLLEDELLFVLLNSAIYVLVGTCDFPSASDIYVLR